MQTGTDYGPYLINEAPPLHTTAIVDACTRRLADVWSQMRANADTPLSTFLDFCTYGHMIDNVVLIVTGLTHERDVQVRCTSSESKLLHCLKLRLQAVALPIYSSGCLPGTHRKVPSSGRV